MVLIVVAVATTTSPSRLAHAADTIDPGASASDLAQAIAADPSVVAGASLVTRPPGGAPTGLLSQPFAGFPRLGQTAVILSTGDVTLAPQPNDSDSSGLDAGGGPVRGDTDRDVTVLRIDLSVPQGDNCLVGIDFRFLSDEYPEFVGSQFNDAFIAELDTSTWTTSGSSIIAPANFAFDSTGNVISINAAGVTSMTAGNAAGTTFDGATPILTAATPITPGAHSLFVSIFDQGDNIYDSAVLVDNLRLGHVNDVATDCRPGAQPSNRPRKLLGAHGITGIPSDMNYPLGIARVVVPDLATRAVNTAKIDGVWQNAAEIRKEAQDEVNQTGKPVDVVAHSKGGLDTRAAMWDRPDLFSDLGMLSTPNGGSREADELCFLRHHGGKLSGQQAQFGPCDDDTDGLFDLQTGYMRDVFNKTVRDWNYLGYWNVAGDCTGFLHFKCNSTALLLGCDDRGGDTAVCVSSAFARTAGESDGVQYALDVFNANHTQMRSTPCPTSNLVAWLYPFDGPDNPWIQHLDGAGCENLTPAAASPANTAAAVPQGVAVASASGSATRLAAAAPAPNPPDTTQRLVNVSADPTHPARLTLDPEGGDVLVAKVYLPAGVQASAQLLDAQGHADPNATTDTTDVFGQTLLGVASSGLKGQPRTLVVTVDRPTELGMVTGITGGKVSLSAAVTPASNGTAAVMATVTGLLPADVRRHQVTATAFSPTGPVTIQLTAQGNPTGSSHRQNWTGTVPLAAGHWTPLEVDLAGAHSRTVLTGGVAPDDTGTFTGLGSTRLIDTDSDGRPDQLQVDVGVRVATADSYQLAVDVATPSGTKLLSAPASAALGSGPGTLTLAIPVAALLTEGVDAPYVLRNAVLTRGTTGRILVATADSLGLTGPVALGGIVPAKIVVARPHVTPIDANGDGKLDQLKITSSATVPSGGSYAIRARLAGPDGGTAATIDQSATFSAGANPLSATVDGSAVVTAGSGRYTLGPILVMSSADPAHPGQSPAVQFILDAGRFSAAPTIQGLLQLWDTTFREGGISNRGFYVSERNRLERVAAGLDAGNRPAALADLDRFISDVKDRGSGRMTDAAAATILAYAQPLRDRIAGGG